MQFQPPSMLTSTALLINKSLSTCRSDFKYLYSPSISCISESSQWKTQGKCGVGNNFSLRGVEFSYLFLKIYFSKETHTSISDIMPVAAHIWSSMVSLFFNFPAVDFFSKALITVHHTIHFVFWLVCCHSTPPPHKLLECKEICSFCLFLYWLRTELRHSRHSIFQRKNL